MTRKKIEEKHKRNAARRRTINKLSNSTRFYFQGRQMIK